nr:hypothetical protein [Tanacetum cinerariifolium]
VIQNATQNPRVQNVGNQNRLIVVSGTNQNPNGNGNLVAAHAEGNSTGQNGNLNGYNDVQNVENQVIQNAAQNPRVQNVGNQNRLIVVSGTNQNPNGNGNLVAAHAEGIQLQAEEFDLMAAATDLDEIEEVNANCILMANL